MDLFLFFCIHSTGERIVIYWTLKTVNWNVIRATFPKWVHLFKTKIKRYTDPASSFFLDLLRSYVRTVLSCGSTYTWQTGYTPQLPRTVTKINPAADGLFSVLTFSLQPSNALSGFQGSRFSVERFAWGTLYLLSPKKWPLMQSVESHKWGW